MHLLRTEMRRHMRRRVIRVMIALALVGCAFAGVVSFIGSSGQSVAELENARYGSPAVLTDWWRPDQGDAALATATVFLLLGGFFAGAAVAGAEWRAGTVTTALTWEPRRVRLHLTRTAACGLCALAVAVALQVVFLGALLPAVLAHGTTDGATSGWWLSLGLAVTRVALLTGLAAVLGVTLATLGRNTAFALGVVFAWMAVVEGIVRGARPGWAPYLWGESLATAAGWARLEQAEFTRGPLASLVTVGVYSAALVAAATLVFRRRDVAGSA
jgi:hypothetical protein